MVKSRIIKGMVTGLTAVIILGTATAVKAETTNNVSLADLKEAYTSAVNKSNELNLDEESAKLAEAKEAYNLYESLKSTDLFAAYQKMIAKANKITKVYTVSEKSAFGFGDEQASQEYWTVARKFFLSYLEYAFADKENISISGVMDRDGGYEKNAGVNIGAYKHYVSVKYTENGETVERFFNYHAVKADGNIAIFEKTWHEKTDSVVAHWTEEVFETSDFFASNEEELAANVEAAQAAYDAKAATIAAVEAEIANLDLEIKEVEAKEAEEARIAEEARLAEEAKIAEAKIAEAKAEGVVIETVEDEAVPVELAPMFVNNTVVAEAEEVAAPENFIANEVAAVKTVADEAVAQAAVVETVVAETVADEAVAQAAVETVADEAVAQAAVVETVKDEVKPAVLTTVAASEESAKSSNDVERLADEMVPEAASETAQSFLWIIFIVLLAAGVTTIAKAKEKLA